jgi:hypothetical protein
MVVKASSDKKLHSGLKERILNPFSSNRSTSGSEVHSMSLTERKRSHEPSPPSIPYIQEQIRSTCEDIIHFCSQQTDATFYQVEKSLQAKISALACLFLQLFLMTFQEQFDYAIWLEEGNYYKGQLTSRTLKTICGEVRYWRHYLARKSGGGFYPLDACIGLTGDGFSPLVMSLATRLATRMSFSASVLLFRCFYGWAPSSEALQHLIIGMGKDSGAYMEHAQVPTDDGEVLIIEVDGKATPTATEAELQKRRGKRHAKPHACGCARHRGQAKRACRGKKKRRQPGDKSKNGRSITLVVMYTLKRGDDGRLHGPINKRVWGSYAPRKVMVTWARRQATKRGFPPGTDKRVHIVVDGETCLYDGLSTLFPQATFALDIRHVEERLWKVGRALHGPSPNAVTPWVEDQRELLYSGRGAQLVTGLKALKLTLSARAQRDAAKREALRELIGYLQKRLSMMAYRDLIDADLVIASGIVEGAARYVVGERLDGSGMRWIPERAEALLHLRCIELNGEWERFFAWSYQRWLDRMRAGCRVVIRTNQADALPTEASMEEASMEETETQPHQKTNMPVAA